LYLIALFNSPELWNKLAYNYCYLLGDVYAKSCYRVNNKTTFAERKIKNKLMLFFFLHHNSLLFFFELS